MSIDELIRLAGLALVTGFIALAVALVLMVCARAMLRLVERVDEWFIRRGM